ncbi:MAG: hypothetical protein JKX97_06030, partial [Candidatus Lindowbacteria bacterium]|nr:hypothetical protein [Candidatus Lindowbacteria bacterium]
NLTLLRQGAALASCFEDILEDILPILPENHPEKFLQKKKNRGIFADAMLENIDDNGSSIDELLTKVTKSREDLKKDLLKLELQGLVVKMPGGIYRVKSV